MNHNALGAAMKHSATAAAETEKRAVPAGGNVMEWYRPVPPPCEKLRWSARDNLNYQETGALAALDYTAGAIQRNAAQFL